METFEIYTLGSGYYLEKVFNAIRLVFASGFNDILKTASLASIVILALRATVTNDLKEVVKWLLGVVMLTSLFLTVKAKVVIIEQLPNTNGVVPAARQIEGVPWGLAVIGSTTSIVGKTIMEKFDQSFAATTNNSKYQSTGLLFGSKIVEDASRLKVSSPSLQDIMVKFYRGCIIPDLKMGHNRKNGYTFDELSEAEDLASFLKGHASNARNIYIDAQVNRRIKKSGLQGSLLNSFEDKTSHEKGYYSCNEAAHIISDMVDFEIKSNMSTISASFISQFIGHTNNKTDKNAFYESVLQDNYNKFLKESKNASSILMQNVMINSIRDSASSVANTYGQLSTDEMSRSSFYSVSQVFQRFIPIIRAVFECLFYGCAPIVLILMVTPIGLEVLKNYAFSFLYLQMWPPMYAVLFTITQSWGEMSASGLSHNMRFLPQIEAINADISMVSGYMLGLIPVLAMFLTKGLVASIGNMATSLMHIPQTASIQSAEQAIRGNYSFGNTSIDTHSYNNLNSNKSDDNYQWLSGMKSFAMPSGAMMKSFVDGRTGLDAQWAMSNLGGQVNIGWNRAIGKNLSESESHAQNEVERHSKDYVESASSGMSKMLGYSTNYSKGTSAYESINKSLSIDQRQSFDYVRGVTDRIAKENNISSEDALRLSMGARVGTNLGALSANLEAQGYTTAQVRKAWSATQDAMEDKRFSESLGQIESFAKTSSIQSQEGSTQDAINSIKSDFNRATSASSNHSMAMDRLHSIQRAKTNYENSSSNFDKQFTNMFIEEYVSKYGAGAFESLVRKNPNNIDYLVDGFIKENNLVENLSLSKDMPKQRLDLQDDDIRRIKAISSKNEAAVNQSSNDFIKNKTINKTALEGNLEQSQSDFATQSNIFDQKMRVRANSVARETAIRKQDVDNELGRSSLGRMLKEKINKVTE
jgi:conjugal transfer mating pair stabilization protein TraG